MSKDVPILLRKAAEVLDRDGWCQGRMDTPGGRRCALGALYKASSELSDGYHVEPDRWIEAREGAASSIVEHLSGEWILVWNDQPERRMSDVVKLFGQVADEEEVR